MPMSARELVLQHVAVRMVTEFQRGNYIDAQNMNTFLASLESMSDDAYLVLANEEQAGAIT